MCTYPRCPGHRVSSQGLQLSPILRASTGEFVSHSHVLHSDYIKPTIHTCTNAMQEMRNRRAMEGVCRKNRRLECVLVKCTLRLSMLVSSATASVGCAQMQHTNRPNKGDGGGGERNCVRPSRSIYGALIETKSCVHTSVTNVWRKGHL